MADQMTLLVSEPQRILSRLLLQPTEIIGEVLQWLDVQDLLNLRLTNHELHNLIHSHEKSIYGKFLLRVQREIPTLQLPVDHSNGRGDLLFYIQLRRQHCSISALSRIMSDHLASKLKRNTPDMEKNEIEQWRTECSSTLQKRLLPALFLLNHFLERLKQVFVDGNEAFASFDDDTFLSMHDIYDLDQQHIIEDFRPCDIETVLDVRAAFSIFLGFLKAKKVSLSTRAHEYPFSSIKKMLISCGLLPFYALLEPCKTYEERREYLNRINQRIWQDKPRECVELRRAKLDSIYHLAIEQVKPNGKGKPLRSYKVRNKFVDRQDVWHKAAYAVLQRQGAGDADLRVVDYDNWILSVLEDQNPGLTIGHWNVPDSS